MYLKSAREVLSSAEGTGMRGFNIFLAVLAILLSFLIGLELGNLWLLALSVVVAGVVYATEYVRRQREF